MKKTWILSSALLFIFITTSFKEEQLRFARVKNAYKQKEAIMNSLLDAKSLVTTDLKIYLRAFKSEGVIEVWGSNSNQGFQLIQTYAICEKSGKLGPKSRRGDGQVPEGFYHINRFNPNSSFHLSLGLDYPNAADRKRSIYSNLGGDIFIHGNCVTIGCLPITDELIKELYIFCVEAKDQGQENIPINIFPCKMTETNLDRITSKTSDETILTLWKDLKEAYDWFEKEKRIPEIKITSEGQYELE